MITQLEEQQLDRIKAEEADFYAQIQFLVLARLMPTVPVEKVADVILGCYADLNHKILTDGGAV